MEIARRSTAKFENRKETVSREAAREKYYENINGSKKANRGLFGKRVMTCFAITINTKIKR